jgi:hypothetical protein
MPSPVALRRVRVIWRCTAWQWTRCVCLSVCQGNLVVYSRAMDNCVCLSVCQGDLEVYSLAMDNCVCLSVCQGDLEVYSLAMDKVPSKWREDRRWRGPTGGGCDGLPSHHADFPSRWVPVPPQWWERDHDALDASEDLKVVRCARSCLPACPVGAPGSCLIPREGLQGFFRVSWGFWGFVLPGNYGSFGMLLGLSLPARSSR